MLKMSSILIVNSKSTTKCERYFSLYNCQLTFTWFFCPDGKVLIHSIALLKSILKKRKMLIKYLLLLQRKEKRQDGE